MLSKHLDEPPPAPSAIEIRAEPIAAFDHRDPDRRRFGMLDFRGGLVLTSPFKEFGGISSINVAPDGANFIAATDRSWWLRGRIVYSGTRPTGITGRRDGADARPRRAHAGGARLVRHRGDGTRRQHRLCRHRARAPDRAVRFRQGRPLARARPIEVPAAFRSFPNNGSVEALAFVPRGSGPLGGSLIAIAERGRDRAGDHLAFLIGGPRPGASRSSAGTTSTSATPPSCRAAISSSWSASSAGPPASTSALRRIPIAEIRPARWSTEPALFEADLGQQVDNMEGISVHRAGGETVLTLISDNNFSRAAAHAAAAVLAGGGVSVRMGYGALVRRSPFRMRGNQGILAGDENGLVASTTNITS